MKDLDILEKGTVQFVLKLRIKEIEERLLNPGWVDMEDSLTEEKDELLVIIGKLYN